MDRRSFVIGLAALGAPRLSAAQQQSRIPRVGVMLMQPVEHAFPQAFRQELRELGYVEGRNIRVDLRTAEGAAEKLPALAAEFARSEVDVIVAGGGTVGARAAMKATRSIPIVFPVVGDPVMAGVVQSLARPGGNITGVALLEMDMNAKRLQLLRELLPGVQRVAFLGDPSMGMYREQVEATQKAGRALGLTLQPLAPRSPAEFEAAFDNALKARAQALVSLSSSFFFANRQALVSLAARKRVVALWDSRGYPEAGGLISYGSDITDMYRIAARYVDRILKGAKPGDLPVEQATKLELVINKKAARDMGLTIPGTLLVRAELLIE